MTITTRKEIRTGVVFTLAIKKTLYITVVFLAANLFAASAAQAQTNVALNKTITGFSSQVNGTMWAATNINDGVVNLTDRAWASVNQAPNSTGLDEWVSIDLGAAYLLDSLRVTSEIVTGGSRNIKDYNLYGSATGDFAGEETLLSSGTIPPLGDMGTHDVAFTPQAFRYVKLQGTSTYFIGSNIYVIVGELALFGGLDSDADGVIDDVDIDDDNDGILDTDEGDGAVDTDGDGLADSLDLDADGDGLPDTTEAQAGTITASGNDTDNDGLDDNFEPGGLPATAQDADSDSTPDWRDLNVAQLVIEKVGTARTTGSTSAVAEDDLIDWVLSYDNQSGGTINNVVLGDVLSGDHSVVSSDVPDGWVFSAGEFTADKVGSGFGLATALPAVPPANNINFGSTGGDGYDPILGADDGRIYMTFHHESSNGVLQCVDPVTGTVCAGYTVLLRPNLISSTKIGQTPENTLFIGNRLYYPYTDPTSSDWGLGCFDVSAYDGVDPLTGNCDKDSNFSGSAWDDGGVSLGGGGVTSDRGVIQGPILADDGNLYLFDYNMLMHCVQPDGNLCATTGTNMSTGDANLFTISADSLYSGTAIEMELWENRIYFGVMYHDVTDGGDPNNSSVVIGCFDIATASNCWGTSAIVDDLTGFSIDASTFSNIHIRYDQAGAADAVCILSRAYDSTRNAEGCASVTGAAIANDDATYCAAYPGGTCLRGIPTNLEALFPNVNRTNGSGGEVHHNGRTYFNRFFTDEVYCWDWSAAPGGALCADFGVGGVVTGPTGAETYGVARDEETGCFWVLGDNNELWNFDVLGNTPCAISEFFADDSLTPANAYCATGPSALTDNGALWDELRLTDIDSDQFIALSADVYDLTGALLTHCDFKANTCSNGFTVVDSGFEETVDLSSLSVAGNNASLSVEFIAQVPLGTDLEVLGRSPGFDLTWDYPGAAPPLELCLVTDPDPTSCPVSGSDFAANSATVQLLGAPNPDDSVGPVSLDIIPSTTAASCSMDYGDAPDSYTALLASDGARHMIQTGTLARYVRLMKSGTNTGGNWLNLAEVEVLDAGGVNRALASLGATASQSSTASGPLLPSFCNDGNTAGTGTAGNICRTNATTANEWWEVDLGAVYNIAEINIFNRDDCCQERLSNVYVLAADTAFPGTTNLTDARNNADFEFQIGEVIAANPDRTVTVTGGTAPTLTLGSTVDSESDGQPSAAADGDDVDIAQNDENGVTFSTVADGSSSAFQVTAHILGVNQTGQAAMLCGYLDGAADAIINGTFDPAVTYTTSQVGLSNPTVGAGNEELCIQVPIAGSTAVSLAGTSNPASATCTGGTSFTCTLTWNPNYLAGTLINTYSRFRLTTDADFFSNSSLSPSGAASNGEIEDFFLQINPTAVSIGKVELKSQSVTAFLAQLGATHAGLADLLALLQQWDPDMAAGLTGADRDAVIEALLAYLDPDGDGQVAVLEWDTLEERGTAGFYVERKNGAGAWVLINDQMLPGMVFAPMGSQYMLADPQAQSGQLYLYHLIEQETTGATREYGPFELEMQP